MNCFAVVLAIINYKDFSILLGGRRKINSLFVQLFWPREVDERVFEVARLFRVALEAERRRGIYSCSSREFIEVGDCSSSRSPPPSPCAMPPRR